MRVHLQHPLSKQVCSLADLWGDITAYCESGHRPQVGKGRAKKSSSSPYILDCSLGQQLERCVWRSPRNNTDATPTLLVAAGERWKLLCSSSTGASAHALWSRTIQTTLEHIQPTERMEIMHGEKRRHLCGTAVTRERDFRNQLLL